MWQHLYIHTGIIILLLSPGCGLRKIQRERLETTQTASSSTYKDSLEMQQQHSSSHNLVQQSDSSELMYELEIWPKGTISITEGMRFTGEAERIRFRGRNLHVKHSAKVADSSHTALKLSAKGLSTQHFESSKSNMLIVKKQAVWKWALIVLAIGVGLDLAYTLYKKKKATHH